MRRDEDTWSLPNVRAIETRQARPSLASQAPKVKRIKGKNISIELIVPDKKILSNAKVRIMASRARRLVKMWFRWEIMVRIAIKGRTGKNDEERKDIASGILFQSPVYKTGASRLASEAEGLRGRRNNRSLAPKVSILSKLSSEQKSNVRISGVKS